MESRIPAAVIWTELCGQRSFAIPLSFLTNPNDGLVTGACGVKCGWSAARQWSIRTGLDGGAKPVSGSSTD